MTIYFCIDKVISSFERTELDNCAQYFDKVVLVTFDEQCKIIQNDKIQVRVISFVKYKTSKVVFKALLFFPVLFNELFSSKGYISNFKLFSIQVSSFLRAIYISDQLRQIIEKESQNKELPILYSFWFNQFATAISIAKLKGLINAKSVSRVHGADLYEERVAKIKRIAFRKFQLTNTDKICSVSEKGMLYLQKKYPKYASKIFTARLGTHNQGQNPFDEKEIFTIVSCAKIRNIKRIHLIPLILMSIDFPIKWIHIGSESKNDPTLKMFHDNLEMVKKAKKNVKIEMVGDITNEEVFKLYKTNPINLFISVSETEGLPVSMMEAISFGIPILATDVGGCNEIVTSETGVLIPIDLAEENISKIISDFRNSNKNSIQFRKGVREFWSKEFESNHNFKQFLIKAGIN